MEINKLGAVGLRKHIVEALPHAKQSSTLVALTDDAAIVQSREGQCTVVGSRLLLEGIHFDLVYFPLQYLGFKAVSSAISEVVAMGGVPTQVTLSVGLSSRYQVSDVDVLMLGVKEAMTLYGVDLVGLQTPSSYTGLTIAVTAIGTVPEGKELKRSGAKKNDLICLTGNVGAAYMGLQLLIREKAVYNGEEDFQPQFEGREYILSRQMKPIARLDVLQQLQQSGIQPSAMANVSDGVANALLALCDSSSVGAQIYEPRLPLDHETVAMAEELGLSPTMVGMYGGDDSELLFTVPLGFKDLVDALQDVRTIGYITDADEGLRMVSSGGSVTAIKPQTYHE